MNKPEIERGILGELLTANYEKQFEIFEELTVEDFSVSKHRELFVIAKDLHTTLKQPIDMVILYSNGFKDATFLSQITQEVTFGKTNIYIKLLKEATFRRKMIEVIKDSLGQVERSDFHDDQEQIKEELISNLNKLELGKFVNYVDIDEYKAKIAENLDQNRGSEGYSWGIKDLDLMTSGIIVPRLIVLGGLKKSGKSRFSIWSVMQLYRQNVKCGFIQLEMPPYEFTKCLYAAFCKINDMKLRSGSMISKIERNIFDTTKISSKMILIDNTPRQNIQQVISRLRLMKKEGCEVVFLDYLQRIDHDRNKQAMELESISNQLADATRELGITVVLLAQLSNLAERETPTIGHLKGSGGVGESADTVLLFDNVYRRTKNDMDKNSIDIYVEQRYGDSGKIELTSDLGSMWFGDKVIKREEEVF